MIYLDNNATTFIDPLILTRYVQLLSEPLGNPHSIHRLGQQARHLLVNGKRRIGEWFGVGPNQIVITSGATEALNLAIRGATGHVITSTLEHAAVREAINQLGCPITRLDPLPGKGAIEPEQIRQAIRPDTQMIVISAANNETGICTHLEAIAHLAAEHDLLLVVDAVAYIGKAPWTMPEGRVAIAISGHKIHAPIGVGALITSRKFPLKPLIYGGGQQRGIRGGTEMVALTDALALALEKLNPNDYKEMARRRNSLEAALAPLAPTIHGWDQPRVGNVTNLAFPNVDGETLLMKLDLEGVATSHGSACQSGGREPSHVLINMGLDRDIVRRSIRLSLSRMTTDDEITQVVKLLTRIVLMPVRPVSSALSPS